MSERAKRHNLARCFLKRLLNAELTFTVSEVLFASANNGHPLRPAASRGREYARKAT